MLKQITLTVEYIQTKMNREADYQSWNTWDSSEWKMNTTVFHKICQTLGMPQIDFFASRLSHQLPRYVSRLSEPVSKARNALQQNWNHMFPYASPPFEFDRRNPEEGNETWNAVEEIFLSSLNFFEALLPRVGNLPWASYALWPLRLLGSRGSRLRDSWAIGAPGSSVTTLLTSIDHSIIQTICSSLYACDEYPVKILVPC